MTFINQNGYKETTNNSFLWTLLFGTLYFLLKGIWIHAIISLILAIFTWGLSWLIYPFFSKNIIINHYLKNGWKLVDGSENLNRKNTSSKEISGDYKNNTYTISVTNADSFDLEAAAIKLKKQYINQGFTIDTDTENKFKLKSSKNSGYIKAFLNSGKLDIELYQVNEAPELYIEETKFNFIKNEPKKETNQTDKLLELSKMLKKGLISEEEFKEHKKQLLL